MDTEKFRTGTCAVGRALALVGDAWSIMILRDAGLGATRFDQFRTSLGMAPNILTQRLKALTAEGLLEKRRYSERPPRHEYVLTEAGRDFLPILLALGAWGRRHNGGGCLSMTVDAETGLPVDPVVIDRTTGLPVGARPTRIVIPETDGAPSPQADENSAICPV